jgi:citrate lyase gamma subunit
VGVQAQALVVAAPGVADVGCSIDDEGANTVLLQASCDGQAARAGSDDDDVRVTR